MPTGAGMLRRVMAGLLALAVLVVSVAPGPWAMPVGHHGQHAAQDCLPPESPDGHPAAAPTEREQAPIGDHHGTTPGLACCIASQCPMLLGSLAPPPAVALPSLGSSDAVAIAARKVAGIELAPALPPPRVAA
jgi:hypothetical protein